MQILIKTDSSTTRTMDPKVPKPFGRLERLRYGDKNSDTARSFSESMRIFNKIPTAQVRLQELQFYCYRCNRPLGQAPYWKIMDEDHSYLAECSGCGMWMEISK